jgi:hypothetical protein
MPTVVLPTGAPEGLLGTSLYAFAMRILYNLLCQLYAVILRILFNLHA